MKLSISIWASFFIVWFTLFSCNRQVSETQPDKERTRQVPERMQGSTNNRIEVYQNPNAPADMKTKDRRNPFVTNPDTVIHLVKTACYGNCPVFTTTILATGQAFYHGKQDVEKLGFYKANIHKRVIQSIDDQLDEIDYYKLDERYPEDQKHIILDAPWTYVFSENGKKRNYIAINHGAPEKLQAFLDFVEAELEQLDWQPMPKNR